MLMNKLPRYVCHKHVHAAKIIEVMYGLDGTDLLLEDADEVTHLVRVVPNWLDKNAPRAGGYYVEYEDGYTSYSPREAFESGYTRNDLP